MEFLLNILPQCGTKTVSPLAIAIASTRACLVERPRLADDLVYWIPRYCTEAMVGVEQAAIGVCNPDSLAHYIQRPVPEFQEKLLLL